MLYPTDHSHLVSQFIQLFSLVLNQYIEINIIATILRISPPQFCQASHRMNNTLSAKIGLNAEINSIICKAQIAAEKLLNLAH